MRSLENIPVESNCLRFAARAATLPGSIEFGVYKGITARIISDLFPGETIHGFDSFRGLPEDWKRGPGKVCPAGYFNRDGIPPQFPPEICLHVGWFKDTLPQFLADYPAPFRFVHFDADLYSSTKTVLDMAHDRFVRGTVVVFGEFCDWADNGHYPNWRDGEAKALADSGLNWEPLARSKGVALAIRILD